MSNFKYMMLSYDELYDFIDDNLNDNLDDFIAYMKSVRQRIKYFRGEEFNFSMSDIVNYFACCFDDDLLVGVVKLKTGGSESVWHPGYKNWLSYVSVDPDYKNKGIATKLLDLTFKFAAEKKINVLMSGYTQEGWDYIRDKVHLFAKEYNVDLCDDVDGPEF